MRIGQLARKYEISTQEITSYLKKVAPADTSFHPNVKLDESTVALIREHFEPQLDLSADNDEKKDDTTTEVAVEEEIKIEPTEVTEEQLPTPIEAMEENRIEAIETDQLLALLEDEEQPVDLTKITHIKASKRTLDGLKVVGKIELAETKRKDELASTKEDKPKQADRSNTKNKRRTISEDEREKRRLKAKRKKEAYERKQENRKKEQAKKQKKASKKAHYEQKMQQIKTAQQKLQVKNQKPQKLASTEDLRPKPKTLLGKFWRWLNTE